MHSSCATVPVAVWRCAREERGRGLVAGARSRRGRLWRLHGTMRLCIRAGASAAALCLVLALAPTRSAVSPDGAARSGAVLAQGYAGTGRRMALRGGSDDARSRRRLVKGKRTFELAPGFFGKPRPKSAEGSAEQSASASSARSGFDGAAGAAEKSGAQASVGTRNPFAPADGSPPRGGMFGSSSQVAGGSALFGAATGGVGSAAGAPFAPSGAAHPFAATASAAPGNNPFAQPSSPAPAGFLSSPFGVKPAAAPAAS